MTFAVGNVAGGTHAGWKRQKPKPQPWECGCMDECPRDTCECEGAYGCEDRKVQPAYMARCTDCGTRRP